MENARPPLSAVAVVVALIAVTVQYLPICTDEILSTEAVTDTFLRRMYPSYVSVNVLIATRLCFGLLCACVTLQSVFFACVKIQTVYMRPQSKLVDTTITMKGRLYLYPFTSWSWIILGVYFLLSAYVTWASSTGGASTPPTWLMMLTLCLWKISAPMTLLIGAVVKYALWPATLKKVGPGHVFKKLRSQLQHNSNIIMAMTELLFLGGTPLGGLQNLPLPLAYGVSYVIFSWATMKHWNPETGPAAIYFFMDTTLGWKHTVSLIVLVGVLLLFYTITCGVEQLADGRSMEIHLGIFISIVLLTCRFRD